MAGKQPAVKNTKWDRAKALQMMMVQGLGVCQIARQMGVKHQSITEGLKRFKGFLENIDIVPAYSANKTKFLDSAEVTLLKDMMDDDRRASASLNNVAYAYQQVANQNRLEQGKSTVNINYADVCADLTNIAQQRADLAAQKAVLMEQIARLSGVPVDTTKIDNTHYIAPNPNDCKGLDDPQCITSQV